jgi:hypothetical protein
MVHARTAGRFFAGAHGAPPYSLDPEIYPMSDDEQA